MHSPFIEMSVIVRNIFCRLLLLKKGRQCKADRVIYTISLKTPAPQHQPTDRKKRKGKRIEDYNRNRAA